MADNAYYKVSDGFFDYFGTTQCYPAHERFLSGADEGGHLRKYF